MHEDKLEHDERLRLEALAQAVAWHAGQPMTNRPSPGGVVVTAVEFAVYIAAGVR